MTAFQFMVKGTNVTLLAFKHCIYVKHNEESAPEYEIAIDYYTDIADDRRLYGLVYNRMFSLYHLYVIIS